MRILVVNPLWPHPSHSFEAANVVLFELISAFARLPGVEVGFLKIENPHTGIRDILEEEKEGMKLLTKQNVQILPAFRLEKLPYREKFRRAIFPELQDFYPGVSEVHKKPLYKEILSFSPDVIFIPWSEWVTALLADVPVKKFAYYGNPDPKSALARTMFDRKYGRIDFMRYFAKRMMVSQLERFHFSLMKKYEWWGDVAANDVSYYTEHGHPHAFYIQNVWIDRFPDFREKRKKLEKNPPAVIVGNIGRLSATANTHGLEILGRDFLPTLRNTLADIPFEIHLFGAGEPHAGIRPFLKAPEIRLRGFIEDIDAELLSAPIFLCLNNASSYKVCHTRYLHAWSLGSCVVAHRDAALSIPEMKYGENALLGGSLQEIAELIKMALRDPAKRMAIGEAGYQTFKKYFTADHVASRVLEKIY